MISLDDKQNLLTGAYSCSRRSVAQQASSLTDTLILLGRNNDRLKTTYDNLKSVSHEYYSVDISDYIHLEDIIGSSLGNRCYINGFVHRAGIEKSVPCKASTSQFIEGIYKMNDLEPLGVSKEVCLASI